MSRSQLDGYESQNYSVRSKTEETAKLSEGDVKVEGNFSLFKNMMCETPDSRPMFYESEAEISKYAAVFCRPSYVLSSH